MFGIIDIGSNTMRLAVYHIGGGDIRLATSKKNTVGLAGYVDKAGNLSEKGIQKAVDTLLGFKNILSNIAVRDVKVFATASLRNITNSKEALETIKKITGYDIRIFSGPEEASFDFYGAIQKTSLTDGLLVDIGGGSTELVFFKDRKILKPLSLPVGSLNMYTRYVGKIVPKKSEMEQIQRHVTALLKRVKNPKDFNSSVICGVGGTLRATCKLNNDIFDCDSSNRVFSYDHLRQIVKSVNHEDKETLMKILRIIPERIHTIVPGMTILRTIAKNYGCDEFIVSEYGVKEGYLLSLLEEMGVSHE